MSKFITNVERNGSTFIVNFPQNPEYEPAQPRTDKVVLRYPGGNATFTLIQEAREIVYYFFFQENLDTTISKTISSATTSVNIPINTNYESITFGEKPSWVTNVSLVNNSINITTLAQEEEQPERTCSIDVKSNNNVLGTFTIKQLKGKDKELVYNYVFVTTNTNEITVQKNSAATTETIYATSENYHNFSAVTQNSEWLTAVCDNNGNVTYTITAQDYNTNLRSGVVKVYASTAASDYNRVEVGTVNVRQDAGQTLNYSYLLNGTSVTGTTISENYSSAATSVTITAVNENYYDFGVETDYPWITCSINSNGNVSYNFTAQQPNTTQRSGLIRVYGYKYLSSDTERKHLATINITQAAGAVQTRVIEVELPDYIYVNVTGEAGSGSEYGEALITIGIEGRHVFYTSNGGFTPGNIVEFTAEERTIGFLTTDFGSFPLICTFRYQGNSSSEDGEVYGLGVSWLNNVGTTNFDSTLLNVTIGTVPEGNGFTRVHDFISSPTTGDIRAKYEE